MSNVNYNRNGSKWSKWTARLALVLVTAGITTGVLKGCEKKAVLKNDVEDNPKQDELTEMANELVENQYADRLEELEVQIAELKESNEALKNEKKVVNTNNVKTNQVAANNNVKPQVTTKTTTQQPVQNTTSNQTAQVVNQNQVIQDAKNKANATFNSSKDAIKKGLADTYKNDQFYGVKNPNDYIAKKFSTYMLTATKQEDEVYVANYNKVMYENIFNALKEIIAKEVAYIVTSKKVNSKIEEYSLNDIMAEFNNFYGVKFPEWLLPNFVDSYKPAIDSGEGKDATLRLKGEEDGRADAIKNRYGYDKAYKDSKVYRDAYDKAYDNQMELIEENKKIESEYGKNQLKVIEEELDASGKVINKTVTDYNNNNNNNRNDSKDNSRDNSNKEKLPTNSKVIKDETDKKGNREIIDEYNYDDASINNKIEDLIFARTMINHLNNQNQKNEVNSYQKIKMV